MSVSMLIELPSASSQTHASFVVGRVESASTAPLRLPGVDEAESPRTHLWVGARGLRRPIRVTVAMEGDDNYIVLDPVSGIFGDGSRLSAAIEDFRAALVSHRDELRRADRLSPHLQSQLQYLSDLLG